MKDTIEANIKRINDLKAVQNRLKGDLYDANLSETGKAVIRVEIDTIQEDVDELTEPTICLIAEYANS